MKNWQKWLSVLGVVALGIGIWVEMSKKKELVTPKIEKVIKIAIMADVHNDTKYLDKAINMARIEGDDFIVIAGDLTINGTKPEEERIKMSLENGGMTYYTVPGNHDDYKKIWVFGQKYQTVIVEGIKVILIDNSSWRGLGAEQWQWITGAVDGCRQIVCLAVMHMPLNNSYSGHIMGEYSATVATEAAKLISLLKDSGVRRVEAGHLHLATSYELDGIRTDMVGAISEERNVETPRFTQLVIAGYSIERRVVEIK